jgi:hypothetical protein
MKLTIAIPAIFASATLSATLSAQAARPSVITPATVAVRGLAPRADTMIGLIGPRKTPFGNYIYAVSRGSSLGKDVYLVTMNYWGGGKEHLFQSDTTALDAATFAPQWRRFHARYDSASVTFNGHHAMGWSVREHSPRVKIDAEVPEAAFAVGMLRWVLDGATLAPGAMGSVSSLDIWNGTVAATSFTVSRSETVTSGGQGHDAWVVEVSGGTQLWLDKRTGQVLQSRNGVNTSTESWMVKR